MKGSLQIKIAYTSDLWTLLLLQAIFSSFFFSSGKTKMIPWVNAEEIQKGTYTSVNFVNTLLGRGFFEFPSLMRRRKEISARSCLFFCQACTCWVTPSNIKIIILIFSCPNFWTNADKCINSNPPTKKNHRGEGWETAVHSLWQMVNTTWKRFFLFLSEGEKQRNLCQAGYFVNKPLRQWTLLPVSLSQTLTEWS